MSLSTSHSREGKEIFTARMAYSRAAALLLAAIFFLIASSAAQRQTLTYDEAKHHRYGEQILALNSERFDDSKMPFSALNALFGRMAGFLGVEDIEDLPAEVAAGRFATLLFGAATALLVYHWSRELYGRLAGLFSLFLFVFEPNLLAHSQFVTTDLYATGTIALAIYALWRFSRRRDAAGLGLLALAIGLAQLAKYTAVFLYPLAAVLLLTRDLPDLTGWLRQQDWAALGLYARRALVYAGVIASVSLGLINAGFLFNRSFTPLGEYKFRSELFQQTQARLRYFSAWPVPVPYPYIDGLDQVLYRERSGFGFGKIYLLGELRKDQGFAGYYLVAYLVKTPLAIQIAVIAAVLAIFWKRKGRSLLENELFLLGPILFFTIYFNFFYWAQIGIRFLLVEFPFLLILCGSLVQDWAGLGRWRRAALGGLAAWLAISTLSYYPHYIPYFNELVLDRRMAYQILADSNLDWGQAGWYARQYLSAHPEIQVDPDRPVSGRILISPNDLVGITAEPETYAWLRENFYPVDTVAYTYLVFDVSPQALERALGGQ